MGQWIEHKEFPITAWQSAVANGSTRLGYWDWVDSMVESKGYVEPVVEAIDYE